MDKLLTGDQMAEILQVSRSFAYQLMRSGKITAFRIGDRAIRVRESDLVEFLDQSTFHANTYGGILRNRRSES
jgi:excisionase family DNA binding protein